MLWGVFSDVHSNLEALEAVLKVFKDNNVRGHICCGDIVGYGPNPNEVLKTIQALPSLRCVRGNHDLAVLGRMDLRWFNEHAQKAVLYTQKVLNKDLLNWLKELPPTVEVSGFTMTHGSPRNPAEEYLVTVQQFLDNCGYFKISPCFVGHSHLPVCFLTKEPLSHVEEGVVTEEKSVHIPQGVKAVLNPGSVGQPRDQDIRASCGIYDDQKRTFRLMRVHYEIEAVQKKMIKADLPEFLALRLSYGQ